MPALASLLVPPADPLSLGWPLSSDDAQWLPGVPEGDAPSPGSQGRVLLSLSISPSRSPSPVQLFPVEWCRLHSHRWGYGLAREWANPLQGTGLLEEAADVIRQL